MSHQPSENSTSPAGAVVSANWLAYADSLASAEILKGAPACAGDLVALGVAGVELPIAHMDAEIMDLEPDFWRLLRNAFDSSGLRVESVHGPVFTYDRFDLDDEAARMRQYAKAATILGARALVVHPVLHPNLHVCRIAAQALDRDVLLATAITQELEGSRCRLALENVPHNSWSYLRELFRRLPDTAGFCFDTGHYQVRPETPLTEALTHFHDRIACWHLSDNHGLCDEHLPPGAGIFDWPTWNRATAGSSAPRIIELSLPTRWENPQAREVCLAAYQTAMAETKRACTLPADAA
ncbi:MAG: TIM barrel protein [Akkermansiaceae bacterium]